MRSSDAQNMTKACQERTGAWPALAAAAALLLLAAGCGRDAPPAGTVGIRVCAGESGVCWESLETGQLPISQLRVGVCERGTTNWTIVLWDGVWRKGWTVSVDRARAPLTIQGPLALPAAAREVAVACQLTSPLRVRSRLGEGFVPSGLQVAAAAPASDHGWAAALPVVVTAPSSRPCGWLRRQFLGGRAAAEEACLRRGGRLETRLFFLHPDLRSLIRKLNAGVIAQRGIDRPVHEIQAVLASQKVSFPPGAYVAEGPFSNTLLIRTTATELNGLDAIRGRGGELLFGPYDPWKFGAPATPRP
jgi:hypothetical protein